MGMSTADLYGGFIDDSQSSALGGAGKGNLPTDNGNSEDSVGTLPAMWWLVMVGALLGIRLLSDYNN